MSRVVHPHRPLWTQGWESVTTCLRSRNSPSQKANDTPAIKSQPPPLHSTQTLDNKRDVNVPTLYLMRSARNSLAKLAVT